MTVTARSEKVVQIRVLHDKICDDKQIKRINASRRNTARPRSMHALFVAAEARYSNSKSF